VRGRPVAFLVRGLAHFDQVTVGVADVAALLVLVLFRRRQEMSTAGAPFGVDGVDVFDPDIEEAADPVGITWRLQDDRRLVVGRPASAIPSGGGGSSFMWHLNWLGLTAAYDRLAGCRAVPVSSVRPSRAASSPSRRSDPSSYPPPRRKSRTRPLSAPRAASQWAGPPRSHQHCTAWHALIIAAKAHDRPRVSPSLRPGRRDRADSPPGQTCPDQGKPWLTQALNGYTSLSPAPFCPPTCPPK
jgi:hypothetical protein